MEEEKVMLRFDSIENPWVKESIRSLRNKLVLDDNNFKVFCVSSLYPKEGVSTIVRMLAMFLSDIQKKVIVVSADLKHKDKTIDSSVLTLKDYLIGYCLKDSVIQTVNDYYDIILGSNMDDDYSDLLYSESFTKLINLLKSNYDIVLIDAPSFSSASETTILSRLADSLILVVKENNVKIQDFSDFYRKLQKQNITIKGVVLNRVSETENLEITAI